ncbi:MAG: cytochrome P450, partial [Lysobacterales bacterium]
LESPVQGLFRVTKEDTELGGKTIPKGSKVYVCYGSANRDDKKFADAVHLNLNRGNASQHMAFSYGIHRCIGQMLARKELAIGLTAILERMDNLQFAPEQGEIRHLPSFILRGIDGLKITFDKTTRDASFGA